MRAQLKPEEPSRWSQTKFLTLRTMSYIKGFCLSYFTWGRGTCYKPLSRLPGITSIQNRITFLDLKAISVARHVWHFYIYLYLLLCRVFKCLNCFQKLFSPSLPFEWGVSLLVTYTDFSNFVFFICALGIFICCKMKKNWVGRYSFKHIAQTKKPALKN